MPITLFGLLSIMSAISGIGNSSDAIYATQLAQTAKLGRNLNSLDAAVQKGDMTAAGAMIATIIQQNPQFALTSSSSSTSQDPINQGFDTVSKAISSNQPDVVKSAWNQLKTDMAKSGITITDGSGNTKKLQADAKKALESAILSGISGLNSSDGNSLSALIDAGAADSPDSVSAVISSWLTYKANGSSSATPVVSPPVAAASAAIPAAAVTSDIITAGGNLNVTA